MAQVKPEEDREVAYEHEKAQQREPYDETRDDDRRGYDRLEQILARKAMAHEGVSRGNPEEKGGDGGEEPGAEKVKALTEDGLRALVEAVPVGRRLLVTLLAQSGLRISELLPLRWKDIDFGTQRRDDLHREWDSAAAQEKQSRTKFAQMGIQPGEVARELAEIRASLGSGDEVAVFTAEALRALDAEVTDATYGFTATTAPLPIGLRDALTPAHREPLPFHNGLPVPPRAARLDRTDPDVAAIARYVLESALDPTLPAWLRPARRCGVMRTVAVQRRTTLLLVRLRMHVGLPGRGEARQVVAEDAQVLAFRGRPGEPEWLPDEDVQALLVAPPSGNVPPDQAADFAERAIADLPHLHAHLDQIADDLAERLREAHLRVREAAGQRVRRQVAVRAQKPADVLGVYVYLPAAQGGPR